MIDRSKMVLHFLRSSPYALFIAALAQACTTQKNEESPVEVFEPLASEIALGPEPDFEGALAEDQIRRNDSLSVALARHGVSTLDVDAIVTAFKGVFDFRTSQPGDAFQVLKNRNGALVWFRYQKSPTQIYRAFRDTDGKLQSRVEEVDLQVRTDFVSGEIEESLYLAMDKAGEKPALAVAFAEMFAWDIDFYTETQKGDQFRMLVEKRFVEGNFVGYGRIRGGEYKSASGKTHRAFFYEKSDGTGGYFSAKGESAKKAFLKSPLRFANITSRFGMRTHPILKYRRAHRGVDYGAAMGTPVSAVADGTVHLAGKQGGYGNVVILRHANGFETRYAHLRGFAKGLKGGKRVSQSQVIGYVGKTGLATGPHLHFEVLKNGKFINPIRVAVPPAPPLQKAELERFLAAIAPVDSALTEGTPVVALSK